MVRTPRSLVLNGGSRIQDRHCSRSDRHDSLRPPAIERGRNLNKLGLKAQDTAELFFNNICTCPHSMESMCTSPNRLFATADGSTWESVAVGSAEETLGHGGVARAVRAGDKHAIAECLRRFDMSDLRDMAKCRGVSLYGDRPVLSRRLRDAYAAAARLPPPEKERYRVSSRSVPRIIPPPSPSPVPRRV